MKRIIFLFLIYGYLSASSQNNHNPVLEFTLQDVIDLALKQSPDILNARHTFRSKYWAYVSYKANYLPSLNFSSTPYFNHSINAITQSDGTETYVSQNQLRTNAKLSIDQNIALTGGTLSLYTNLDRIDALDNKTHTYKSTPIQIYYTQPLFGYNSLKWDKMIEPLRFEEAKKNYVEMREAVAVKAVSKFFNLALAQSNVKSAEINYENAKTLYSYAQGRYNIGTISENEILQLEINMLSAETSLMNYSLLLDDYMEDLRSYLRISDTHLISLIIDDQISLKQIDMTSALQHSIENSPDMIYIERIKKESDNNVAYVKGNTGFRANLGLQFGLAQTSRDLEQAYRNLKNEQIISVSISFPILDWERDKGKVEVAKSSRDLIYAQAEQDRKDFEMNIIKLVKQFNLQPNTLSVAYKQDQTAEKRSEVARSLYMSGKSTILDLNSSIEEKDSARRNYINTIFNYWHLYYTLRMYTLYDFEKDIIITEDYKELLK
ncbi:outer membrane protein TolC [Dysgonomonadaceae bacterium PH5-43]|nr:outer membrane protein TolC [Dysgonomonadaceae bacterium PH5-43]